MHLPQQRWVPLTVAEVTYSNSISVAEHVVMMILALVRNYIPSHQVVLDGAVNGAGWVARGLSRIVNWVDRRWVDGFVNAVGGFTGATGGLLKYLQNGNVQWYAVLLFVGVVALSIVFVQMA